MKEDSSLLAARSAAASSVNISMRDSDNFQNSDTSSATVSSAPMRDASIVESPGKREEGEAAGEWRLAWVVR